MSQVLQTSSVAAPGFFGLNTQDSPLDLASGFALVATNCIIDQFGRIGAREGFSRVNSSSGALGANNVTVLHELVQADGTMTILFAGNNKLFKLDGSNAVVELTYGGGGTAPTITASNWSVASLAAHTFFFQEGHDPLVFDPSVSTTTFRRITEHAGSSGTPPSANIVISAYGRLWAADTTTDNVTLFFSDLLHGYKWTGGSSGVNDINKVWPNGADNITGLAAHNNFLIIFGSRQILVFEGPRDPLTISVFKLNDSVGGIGCIARDSIQQTGKDVLFLSNSGVRSFARTILEKSLPVGDLSKNIRNDLMQIVSSEVAANIKSVYSESKAFYLLTLPSVSEVYCFDTRGQLQDGSFRVTRWDSIAPTSLLSRRNGDVFLGKNGFVCKYGTYQDHTTLYRLMYFTNHADLGNQNVTSLLKRIKVVVIGGSNQIVTIKFGFDFFANYQAVSALIPAQSVSEYGVAEFDNPNGQISTITNASPSVITSVDSSAFVNGNPVTLTTTGTLPSGFSVLTTFFVINASGNTCNLSLTLAGAAINTTTAGSGTHTVQHIHPAVVAEYSGGVALQTLSVPASGSGKIVQTGYESNINGTPLSIQRIEIQSKDGKIS